MADANIQNISEQLKNKIKGLESNFKSDEVGTVTSVGDGIAKVYGLDQAMAGELVSFDNGVIGLVLNLEEDSVGVAIFGDDSSVLEGDTVAMRGTAGDTSQLQPVDGISRTTTTSLLLNDAVMRGARKVARYKNIILDDRYSRNYWS